MSDSNNKEVPTQNTNSSSNATDNVLDAASNLHQDALQVERKAEFLTTSPDENLNRMIPGQGNNAVLDSPEERLKNTSQNLSSIGASMPSMSFFGAGNKSKKIKSHKRTKKHNKSKRHRKSKKGKKSYK